MGLSPNLNIRLAWLVAAFELRDALCDAMPMKTAEEEWASRPVNETDEEAVSRYARIQADAFQAGQLDMGSFSAGWLAGARAQRESDWSAHGRGQCRERIRNNPLVTDAASPKPRGET